MKIHFVKEILKTKLTTLFLRHFGIYQDFLSHYVNIFNIDLIINVNY